MGVSSVSAQRSECLYNVGGRRPTRCLLQRYQASPKVFNGAEIVHQKGFVLAPALLSTSSVRPWNKLDSVLASRTLKSRCKRFTELLCAVELSGRGIGSGIPGCAALMFRNLRPGWRCKGCLWQPSWRSGNVKDFKELGSGVVMIC